MNSGNGISDVTKYASTTNSVSTTVSSPKKNLDRWIFIPTKMIAPMSLGPWIRNAPGLSVIPALGRALGPATAPVFFGGMLNPMLGKAMGFFGFDDVTKSCHKYEHINIRIGLQEKFKEEVLALVLPGIVTTIVNYTCNNPVATFAESHPLIVEAGFGYIGYLSNELGREGLKRLGSAMHPNEKMTFDAFGMSEGLAGHEWFLKGLLRQADYCIVTLGFCAFVQRCADTEGFLMSSVVLAGCYYLNQGVHHYLTTPDPCGKAIVEEVEEDDQQYVSLEEANSNNNDKASQYSTTAIIRLGLKGAGMVMGGVLSGVVAYYGYADAISEEQEENNKKSPEEKVVGVTTSFATAGAACYGIVKGTDIMLSVGYELSKRLCTWWRGSDKKASALPAVNGLATGFVENNKTKPLADSDELTKAHNAALAAAVKDGSNKKKNKLKFSAGGSVMPTDHSAQTPATLRGEDRSKVRAANSHASIRL